MMASAADDREHERPAAAWRPQGWKASFDKASPEHLMAALLGATGALRAHDLIGDEEAAQLAQMCMCCSVQEALILGAALAAYDDSPEGRSDFLGLARTIANKPVPAGSTAAAGMDAPLPPTLPVASPQGGGFTADG